MHIKNQIFSKTKLNIVLLIGIIFSLFTSSLFSQEEVSDTTYIYEEPVDYYYSNIPKVNLIDAGVLMGLPQKAFKRFHPRSIWGGHLAFHRQHKAESPLFIGGSLGYYAIDHFSSEVERIFDNFNEIWDGSTTSNLIDINLSARYFLDIRFWIIEPYIEPSIGFNWFFTNTTFSFPDTDESDFNNNDSSAALNYGGSLGLLFYVGSDFYINCNAGYYPGLATSFYILNRDNKDVVNSTFEAFDRKRSATDMMRFKLGVTYAF